ncbi:TPA: hypothetical protein U5E37_002217 [Yersinia enterocolitica]|uniref:hypothetical protein n=1 Tax=Yersinia enterocolitica TaxID=630 RepID=UPI00094B9CEE|nr:hypothetical protein [Yersinia enterocolitica]ELI7901162.1 hypothetical protein [Yersinia enterocolitica]ELI8002654.1 hypothetical protein [Yersinia enterocolitica]ELX2216100.1 hypothetical protein [Yersinia enterocolitica]HEB1858554.1 hypothetical protein [Yersinia enterocolitica]HEF7235945.1 hypothetical protein [Yersinia enterocolitica]
MIMKNRIFNTKSDEFNWITIPEAIAIATQIRNSPLTEADIYRHALYGDINLSIYFQSPVILRRIKTSNAKAKLNPIGNHLINQLCILEKNCFINNRNLIVTTDEKYTYPTQQVIDTTLIGYEYVLAQRLLARSLGIPLPVIGENHINYGLSVNIGNDHFQIFEKVRYRERIKQQIIRLPKNIALHITEKIPDQKINQYNHREYFPIHDLPKDACFVIKHTELGKLTRMSAQNDTSPPSSTRISTPLSRLFWLACKNNESISPLIRQPYKLLSIFEQWASDEGITDRFSGDTLKTALERGSPTSI